VLAAPHPIADASARLCGVGLGDAIRAGPAACAGPLAAGLARAALLASRPVAHAGPGLCGVGLGDAIRATLGPALAPAAGPLAAIAADAARVALSASRCRGVAALALAVVASSCKAGPELMVAFVVMVVALVIQEPLHQVAKGGVHAGDAPAHLVLSRH